MWQTGIDELAAMFERVMFTQYAEMECEASQELYLSVSVSQTI